MPAKKSTEEGDFPKSQKRTEAECEKTGLRWPGLKALGHLQPDWYIDQGLRSRMKFPTHGDQHLNHARTCHFLRALLFATEGSLAVFYESFNTQVFQDVFPDRAHLAAITPLV